MFPQLKKTLFLSESGEVRDVGGVGPGQLIFHRQPDLPQQCDSLWRITRLKIEIWQNNAVFYNSVLEQKYGSRKLNSASSRPCQSQRFSIKGQIIVLCLPPVPADRQSDSLGLPAWHWKIFVLTRPQITRRQVLKLNVHSMCICYILFKSVIW